MKTNIDKVKTLETSLVLTTFFVVIFFFTKNELFLIIATGLGITGIFIQPIAKLIAKGWFALANGLNFVFSKVVLGLIFFVFLTPISAIYRIVKNDKLQLSRNSDTTWKVLGKPYTHDDLKNIW